MTSSAYPAQAAAAVPIDPEAAAAVAIDPEADEAAAKSCKDIHQAAKEGNVGAVRHFLRVDPESLEREDGVGRSRKLRPTPLHRAAEHGHVEVVALLLRSGASLEATANFGRTALDYAAAKGHAAVVEQLISAGATVDAADKDGQTALRRAALEGHAAVVEQLISAGATVDAADNNGRTALHRAALEGHAAVVEQLISAGATVEAANNDGWTALHRAADKGHAAVVEQLISAGATVDAADRRGKTPLHEAAENGHAAVVEQLISAGATVDAARKDGRTPYDLAEEFGRRQVMGLLRPVFVALLSGRSCRCDSSQDRTVLELKEEAEKKLGVKIKHIIGQNHEPLDESMELAAAHIVPGNTLTAVISEDVLEEGHPEEQAPAQPADPSMPEDGVEIKDFPHGIRLMAQQAIFEAFDPQIEVLENWSDLKEVSALEEALPAGHVPLARLLRLTPEDRTFPAPVKVQVPTCAGAETLWRSSTTGWEQVETATFEETRATVTVDHFCEFVVTGKPHPLKGLGFLHAQGENAQVIIMHTGCESCERNLEVLCSDPDSLQPLRRCSPNLQLGTFHHDEDLEIKQPGRTSKMKIRFHRMPLMSPELDAQSRQHFDVEIEDQNHCFKIRPEETTAATAATASRSVGPHAASSAQASSAALTGDMESAAALRHAAGRGVKRLCVSGLPPSAAVTGSVASTDRGHLMLSGRFNSDAIVAYMKEVKSQLEARHVPVFMVDASAGQDFGQMTCEGLYHAKGMVAFCTSEYGAYTGAGYETFYELEFAHQNQLPLFPIKLCDQWPPAPQNNERGTCQNKFVFKKSLVFAEDLQMTNAKGVADKIAESVARLGIFRN